MLQNQGPDQMFTVVAWFLHVSKLQGGWTLEKSTLLFRLQLHKPNMNSRTIMLAPDKNPD